MVKTGNLSVFSSCPWGGMKKSSHLRMIPPFQEKGSLSTQKHVSVRGKGRLRPRLTFFTDSIEPYSMRIRSLLPQMVGS